MQNLVITGIPRSGTSLAAAIIDQVPDAFCLSEPENQIALMDTAETAQEFVIRLIADFDAIRQTLLAGATVFDRRGSGGRAVTNYFGRRTSDGRRGTSYTIVPVSRGGLSLNFLLGIKHNALYAAVLPEILLHSRLRVVALVRDPVAVILSWKSLDLPVSRGQLPAAERFWPEMARLTHAEMDLTDKQIRICDLLCRRFAALDQQISLVRYESLVVNPASLLAACGIKTSAVADLTDLAEYQQSCDGVSNLAATIAERIRTIAAVGDLPGICHFYPSYSTRPSDP